MHERLTPSFGPPAEACLSRPAIAARQRERLAHLIARLHGRNAFYTRKFEAAGLAPDARDPLRSVADLPFTTKSELIDDQTRHAPWGTDLSEPIDHYTRYWQTSSTSGRPLCWIDTTDSWQWVIDCWKAVYQAAHVSATDRIFFPFSFGPFLGFWSAFEAACQIGAHAIPGGGMSSPLRLATIRRVDATVMCCTPSYALRLAEVAAEEHPAGPDLAAGSIRVIIVAGEPGGSIPTTRQRIEAAWGARVIDHYGLTEVGPVAFECWERERGLHLNEAEFIGEVIDPATAAPQPDGLPGELVLTNLGRAASPVLRYRTGDIVVRTEEPCVCGRTMARFDGGILARADDMVTVRGVNVYPAAIEAVVRGFTEVVEFRSTIGRRGPMREVSVEIEVAPAADSPAEVRGHVALALQEALGLKVPVEVVPGGTLPRFEMKARRFVIQE